MDKGKNRGKDERVRGELVWNDVQKQVKKGEDQSLNDEKGEF